MLDNEPQKKLYLLLIGVVLAFVTSFLLLDRWGKRMELSDGGLDFIKRQEGFSEIPYFCSAHKLTVGWGHVLSNAEKIELLYTLPITPDLKYAYVQVLYENADIKKILELDEFLEQQKFKFNVSVLTKFLLNDLAKVERCVNDARVPLSQNQYDALVSFTFNVGCDAFLNSTLLKKCVIMIMTLTRF